jgi:hypothetical protein
LCLHITLLSVAKFRLSSGAIIIVFAHYTDIGCKNVGNELEYMTFLGRYLYCNSHYTDISCNFVGNGELLSSGAIIIVFAHFPDFSCKIVGNEPEYKTFLGSYLYCVCTLH